MIRGGLFIGRFQPPHWGGHVWAVRDILNEVDELIVVIGSAQFNYIIKDPFTVGGERIWMLREALREGGVDLSRVIIVPIPNIENNAAWFGYLRSYVPPFQVAYTGNPFVAMLLREAGIEVRQQPLYDRQRYNSTRIRELMLKDDPEWEGLVPKSVAEIIRKINGIERLKTIATGEAEPHKW
ncbi:nicotinamide-nucleotide adenylyltransferase [Vulcanisaeta distributa]|uniref:nicotinamide-nucleotide adenylyltransferase n=1 Tax=Vulcanisaeta distributa TaxID=164451 RepID=UPI0006D13F53|nr:nicotinamide-nucleotide adenylyltransferase [Vulcanisaeta distributa]